MKTWKTNGLLRITAAVLCILSGTLAFWSGLFMMGNWDDFWSGGDFYQSYSIIEPFRRYYSQLVAACNLTCRQNLEGELPYTQKAELASLTEELDSANTNFRFQVRDEDGSLLASSLGEEAYEDLAARSYSEWSMTVGESWYKNDQLNADGSMVAYLGAEGTREVPASWWDQSAADEERAGQSNEYGWAYSSDEGWTYSPDEDSRVYNLQLILEYGVVNPLVVDDSFAQARDSYLEMQDVLAPMSILFCLSSLVLFFNLLIFLRGIGHRRSAPNAITPTWQEKIPLDLYLAADWLVLLLLLCAVDPITYHLKQSLHFHGLVALGVLSVIGAGFVLALLATVTMRLKTHTLLKNVLVFRLCRWLWRHVLELVYTLPMLWRVILGFGAYFFLSIIFYHGGILYLGLQALALVFLCLWTYQWKRIRAATAQILAGNTNVQINTKWMFHDLEEHARQLNHLSDSVTAAVDQQLKSERFKAELITNVSHDLKTPLTSIINYVDLLKKQDIQDPKALEYLDVLDRKSQRLKKLTEDLVEASKASTGSLSVNLTRLGYGQLVSQALGEYEDKFQSANLTLVTDLPADELYILADGRHLWRVIDNLLGNCCKYAMPGTRVYLAVFLREDCTACLSMKNISKNALNMPPEQLMERFVRGDASRTSEGSGLGLSIARSLTELQGGSFALDIDGDLFKAQVSFPIAPPSPISFDDLTSMDVPDASAFPDVSEPLK